MAQCGVCLEDIHGDDVSYTTVCEHKFHNQCITQWLLSKSTCPCCRRDLGGNGGVGDEIFESGDSDSQRAARTIFQIFNGDYLTQSDEDNIFHLGECLAVCIAQNLHPRRWKQRKEGWTSSFTGSKKQRFIIRADVVERHEEGACPHYVALDVFPLHLSAEIEGKDYRKNKLLTQGTIKQWRSMKPYQRRRACSRTTKQ